MNTISYNSFFKFPVALLPLRRMQERVTRINEMLSSKLASRLNLSIVNGNNICQKYGRQIDGQAPTLFKDLFFFEILALTLLQGKNRR